MSGRALRWLMSLAHRRADAGTARLTIIRHHRVYRDGERPLYRLGVRESVLRDQLELLQQLGLTPLGVAEGVRRLDEGRAGHWVALSFDDGYADNVRAALPLLAARGACATFYLTAGLMETRRAPWWDVLAHALERSSGDRLEWSAGGRTYDLSLHDLRARVRALAALIPSLRVVPAEQAERLGSLRSALGVSDPASCELATWAESEALVAAGMEVGAHTMSHPFLSLLPGSEQDAEIRGSMDLIQRRLGVRVQGLAYPGGDYDAVSLDVARLAGLAYAASTRAGDNAIDQPRHELLRRGLPEGACLGPGGRFSRHLTTAELDGAFDRLRAGAAAAEAAA
ncbi:MAG TPA: polysaccharide deacetylase family protein [Candidatus Limnocylindria bacterium]|nr:polysaccharide deacetylase family protein [Candidatus Limnocylindria bacterium]